MIEVERSIEYQDLYKRDLSEIRRAAYILEKPQSHVLDLFMTYIPYFVANSSYPILLAIRPIRRRDL